jgi:hypothetical protein
LNFGVAYSKVTTNKLVKSLSVLIVAVSDSQVLAEEKIPWTSTSAFCIIPLFTVARNFYSSLRV